MAVFIFASDLNAFRVQAWQAVRSHGEYVFRHSIVLFQHATQFHIQTVHIIFLSMQKFRFDGLVIPFV